MVYVVVLCSLSQSTNEKQLQGDNIFLRGGFGQTIFLQCHDFVRAIFCILSPTQGIDWICTCCTTVVRPECGKHRHSLLFLVRKKKTARSCFSRRSLSITGVHSCLTRIFYQLHQDFSLHISYIVILSS